MGIDGGMSDGMGGLCSVLSSEKAIDEYLNAIKRNSHICGKSLRKQKMRYMLQKK